MPHFSIFFIAFIQRLYIQRFNEKKTKNKGFVKKKSKNKERIKPIQPGYNSGGTNANFHQHKYIGKNNIVAPTRE